MQDNFLIFENLLTSYNPAEMDPDEWNYKVYDALDNWVISTERMTNRHWVRLGTDGENGKKQLIME